MSLRTFIIAPGQKKKFFPKSRPLLGIIVQNDGGKLRFEALDDSVRYIAGRRMREKVREPVGIFSQHDCEIEMLESERVQLTPPDGDGMTFVYLEECDGLFNIVSGASLISFIIGRGLRSRVEPDSKIEA